MKLNGHVTEKNSGEKASYQLDKLKKLVDEIDKHEERYKALTQTTINGLLVVDMEGHILEVNEAYCTMSGYTSDHLLTMQISDIDCEESAEESSTHIQRIMASGFERFETSHKKADGSVINVQVNVTFIDSEGVLCCLIDDITQRKRRVSALKQIKMSALKLESSMFPIGDIDNLNLGDIIDCKIFQMLMDDFYKLTKIGIGIIDIKGNILVSEGWQDICVKFHRVNPETCKNCLESDFELTTDVLPGEFKQYKCKNNMWDIATPIWIGKKRMGNIFLGQFLYDDETIDYEFFKKQAQRYGFDEKEYLEALERVPRFSHEVVKTAMQFYSKLAGILSQLSFGNISLNRSLVELKNTMSFEQALMDAVPTPIFYKNAESVFIGGNKAFEEYVGLLQEQFVGKTAYDIAPADLAEIYDKADRALMSGQGVQCYESSVVYADGTRHDVVFNKATFTNVEGEIAGLIGVILDITERKRAEEALRIANDQLELKVEERTQELMALNQELMAINDELISTIDRLKKAQLQLLQSEKMAALGGLVAGMSHEISTPIGISVTGVSYVQKELAQISNKLKAETLKRAEFDDFISETTVLIQTVVVNLERADLLIRSFKQISVDQTTEEKRWFNVKSYLEELLLSLNPLFRKKTHQVIIECPENLQVISYPGLIAQILTNFITNSLKHGFDADFSGIIRIHFDKFGSFYTLTYSDNGKGMPEEVLEHIYDPFFTTKRGGDGGTGLGLNLVYNIVTQQLCGEIKCFSELGKGSNFVITFPDIYGE